jgi:hypothetical protein
MAREHVARSYRLWAEVIPQLRKAKVGLEEPAQ